MNRYVPDPEDPRWGVLRAHGCAGKVSYPSKRIWKGVLRVMVARADPGSTLAEYHCRVCHRWHLGNSRQRAPQGESPTGDAA